MPVSADITTPIAVTDFSFETHGANYSGSGYADQTNIYYPYNSGILGEGEPYQGWLTVAANYQIYSVSTSGATGSFNGANAVQVNGNSYYGYTLESLTPVVASIANNATYTLTFALANDGGGAGNVTLSLLTTSSAPNTTDYSTIQLPGTGTDPMTNPVRYYPAPPNPYPILTTVNTIASTVVSGSTINAQTVGDFTDYSVTFDTLSGHNAASVGQDLTLALNVDSNSSLQFDNARLTVTTVPEPSTYAMMLGALAFLGLCVRRRLA
jgi:hypothetical protein